MKFLLFCLIGFTINSFAQTPKCDLTLKDSPIVQGLSLGMPQAEVLKLYPVIKSNGMVPINSPYIKSQDVRSLHVEFYKNKLLSFTIFYRPGPQWANGMEFGRTVSESLKLPIASWQELGGEQSSILFCKEFTVTASLPSVETARSMGSMLIFSDEIARKERIIATKDAEEQKKKAFKP